MANYSLILDTKFKPFSYQEMLAPVAAATQAHQLIEDEYGKLSQKAGVWEEIASEESDPYAYKMYKNYANDLQMQAEQLLRYGLNASSRSGMLDMRTRYSKEITPIEEAYTRREKLADEQRKALAQNPSMMYQRNVRDISLDDFIRNPTLDYGAQYSGALLTKQVSDAVSNLAKEARDSEQGRRILRQILPYQYEVLQQRGFSREAVEEAIKGNPGILNDIVERTIDTSGIRNWGNPEILARAYNYARQGLYNAIGETSYSMVTDSAGLKDYEAKLARDAKQQEIKDQIKQDLKMYDLDPTPLYGESEIAEQNKDTLKGLQKWNKKGYITSDGKLTKKGWAAVSDQLLYDAYNRADSDSPYVQALSNPGRDAEFLNWATEHGLNYSKPKKVDFLNARGEVVSQYTDPQLLGYEHLQQYYNTTMQDIESGKLVTDTPNIDIYRQSLRSDQDKQLLLNKITSAIKSNGKIYQVTDLNVDQQGNITMSKNKNKSQEEFKKIAEKYPIVYIANSPMTNNQLIELANGEIYVLPKGVLGSTTQDDINDANLMIRQSQSGEEKAINLNRANSYLGALLNYNTGTAITTNNGIITVPRTQ